MRSVRRTWTSRATARERGGIVGMRIPSQRRGCANAAQLWDQLIFYAAILSSTGASIQSVSAQRETTGETFHTAAPDRTVGKKNKKEQREPVMWWRQTEGSTKLSPRTVKGNRRAKGAVREVFFVSFFFLTQRLRRLGSPVTDHRNPLSLYPPAWLVGFS